VRINVVENREEKTRLMMKWFVVDVHKMPDHLMKKTRKTTRTMISNRNSIDV